MKKNNAQMGSRHTYIRLSSGSSGQQQITNDVADARSFTKSTGGLLRLHITDDDTINWLKTMAKKATKNRAVARKPRDAAAVLFGKVRRQHSLMAGRVTTLWVRRPLSVNQHGQLSLPSLRGRLNE